MTQTPTPHLDSVYALTKLLEQNLRIRSTFISVRAGGAQSHPVYWNWGAQGRAHEEPS